LIHEYKVHNYINYISSPSRSLLTFPPKLFLFAKEANKKHHHSYWLQRVHWAASPCSVLVTPEVPKETSTKPKSRGILQNKQTVLLKTVKVKLGMVVLACNPSYSGG
jgi:hypothetical protein